MIWLLLLLVPSAHASYDQDYKKIKICEELRVNLREMPVEECFTNSKFKFSQRDDVTDFKWRLKKGGLWCTGTVYDDGYIHIDGCYR